jgi:tetratricopeptide (TPR) repeat protein
VRHRDDSTSQPPSVEVREHDVDWATFWSLRQGRHVAQQGRLRQVLATFSPLHLVCLGVLLLALADVAITALPTLRRAAFSGMTFWPRGAHSRLEKRARLQAAITDRTHAGDYRSAIELTTALVADLKSDLNDASAAGDVKVLEAGDTLADLYLLQGDHDRAEAIYARHLEALTTSRVPAAWAGSGVPEVLGKLAQVHVARGDEARAESLCRKALQMCDDYSPDHPFTREVLDDLAALCRRTGRDAEAEALEARSRLLPAGGTSR